MAFMWKRPDTGAEEEVRVLGEAEHATDPGDHLHIQTGGGEFIVPAGQIRDTDEIEEHELTVGSVWVDTDPRFPRRRVKIMDEVDDAGWMTVSLVGRDGRIVPGTATRERYTRFIFGDAFRPDDTGLPIQRDEEPEDCTGIGHDGDPALAD